MPSVDVAVVGAGLAGLAAARALAARGLEVLVLEARDRVGGRTVGHTFANGCVVEMGGQWIGPSHGELLRLVDELGLETFPTYDDGAGLTVFDGEPRRWSEDSLGLSAPSEAEIERLHGLVRELAEGVPLEAPWTAPDSTELDRQTVESWVTSATEDPIAQAWFRVITPILFAAGTHEIPLLHFLFYVQSGGSLDELIATAGGAQELRVEGGSHRLAERMAQDLPAGAVVLGAPVHEIRHDPHGVQVVHADGELSARHVIVTLPPALAGELRYEPALPADRSALTREFPMGNVIKFQARYDDPWWRGEGLSGQAVSFDGPIATTFDNSPADGRCGILLGFAEADHARQLGRLSLDERRRTVLECFQRFFGPRARDAREVAEHDWSAEEYTRGCYGGHPGAGILSTFGSALREPVGRIHWAGAETSDVASGYMEGAVRSGLRAAAEIAEQL